MIYKNISYGERLIDSVGRWDNHRNCRLQLVGHFQGYFQSRSKILFKQLLSFLSSPLPVKNSMRPTWLGPFFENEPTSVLLDFPIEIEKSLRDFFREKKCFRNVNMNIFTNSISFIWFGNFGQSRSVSIIFG